MPITAITENGKSGYKSDLTGKKFFGDDAKAKAEADAKAAEAKKNGNGDAKPKPPAPEGVVDKNAEQHATKPFRIFTADPTPGPRRYTRDELQNIADNFGDSGRIKTQLGEDLQNPVVIGHEEDQEVLRRSDLPAAGWLHNVYMEGDNLMGVAAEVPDPVRTWVDGGQYRTWSAEIYRDYKGMGPTLRRVALLGADIPHKKDLGKIEWENHAEGEEYETITQHKEGYAMTRAELIAKLRGPVLEAATAESFSEAQVDAFFETLTDETLEKFAGDEMQFEAKGMMRLVPVAAPAAPAAPKPAAPAAPAAAGGLPVPGAAPAPQRFTETEEGKALKGLVQQQNNRIAELENKAKNNKIEAYVEGLVSSGQVSGENVDRVRSYLRKSDGIEKYAEGESALDTAMATLAAVLPKKEARTSPVTVGAAGGVSDDAASQIKTKYDQYAELLIKNGQFGSTSDKGFPTVEQFCEFNGYETPEQFKESK